MMATVTLRALAPVDVPHVERLVTAVQVFRPDEVPVALEVAEAAIEAPETDYWSLAATDDDDHLIGFALFGPVPCTQATWDLYWIVVDPTHQRTGLGRHLLLTCEQRIQDLGGRLIVIETSSQTSYSPARAMYEALGYRPQATIPGYYGPDDHLVIYAKSLGAFDEGTTND